MIRLLKLGVSIDANTDDETINRYIKLYPHLKDSLIKYLTNGDSKEKLKKHKKDGDENAG